MDSLYLRYTTNCVVYRKWEMKEEKPDYNYLEDFIDNVRGKGKYSFTLTEAKHQFGISDKALNQNLFRLKSKKRIAPIRKEFYGIITPEYATYGMLPAHLFINDMMQSLHKKYYVGLLSAAALHGAGHQQPMEYFVVTEKPSLRTIQTEKLKINFYVKKEWQADDIVQKKTDAGYINVSSPELTALDLLYFNEIGLNRAFTIIQELAQEMKSVALAKTAKHYPQTSAIQRLGYLIEQGAENEKLVDVLVKALKSRRLFPVPLFKEKEKRGEIDAKWKVIVNKSIEGDL